MKPEERLPSIVFVSAELAPFATSGGLGDVSRSLPRALAALGHRVSVFLPLYQSVRRRQLSLGAACEIATASGGRFRVFHAPGTLAPASLYLVEHDGYFDRPGLYGDLGGEYGDNLERFGFFSQAVLETVAAFGLPADVVHANDWHTGSVPGLLRTVYAGHPLLGPAASVFTIHNLAYQGRFGPERLPATGLPWSVFHMDGVEYYGGINLMKAGIAYARAITTVSPRYAEEIRTPELGEGLDGLLRARAPDLHGILNGIDDEIWNPATDRHLPATYGATALEGKHVCKQGLLAEVGLPIAVDAPCVGMVTRMNSQKGPDIVLGVADDLLRLGVGLVFLGSGEGHLEHGFRELGARRPDRVAVRIGFDESFSHRIEAGADMFLMPSRREPCGLNQMYSLRYGTIPVVRATGGLADTVRDPDEDSEHPNGFKFERPWGTDLVAAVRRAVDAFRDRRRWQGMMRTAMAEDFSWRASARRYSNLYRSLSD
ncbi:MAG TPA: glycogen synthase GlgA [Candidatus Binatia bacterium]|nr:glycogen synthase GlgA [Candidatus Binatia bacterium]